MERFWCATGAISAALAVMAGAFGAHALKARLEPDLLAIFEVGARYHMYHALGLLAVGLAWPRAGGTPLQVAGIAMLAGTVVFSGSLYALALTGVRALGAVTPIGGLGLIAGWVAFAWGVLRAP